MLFTSETAAVTTSNDTNESFYLLLLPTTASMSSEQPEFGLNSDIQQTGRYPPVSSETLVY